MGNLLSNKPAAAAASDEGSESRDVIAIHSAEEWNQRWNSHLQSKKLMVIDFSASWCGPCRLIEPAFKAMASKYSDVVFTKIDVDELSEVPEQWKVQALPTFVLLKGKKELGRVVGAKEDELTKKIEKLKS